MKLPRFLMVLILVSLALGVGLRVLAATGDNVQFSLSCSGFSSSGGDVLLDRDNTGRGREEFVLSAVDGAGNVIFAGLPDSFFVGGTISWVDGGTFGWTFPPRYNPLTLRVISLAGNDLPAQVVHTATGSCTDLPTISLDGQGGGGERPDIIIILDALLLEGATSPSVPLNTAPPRPANPLGLAESLPGYAIVATDNLSVRSGDGPEYTLIGIVDGGTTLVVLGRNRFADDTESWWYVQVGNLVGWVNGEYLVFRGDLTWVPEVPVQGELIQPRFFLIRETAPLYVSPNFEANGICQLQGNTEYLVVGRDTNIVWYEIEADCNGTTVTGWIPAYLGAIRNPAALFIPVTT
jgi:hypothetical protein